MAKVELATTAVEDLDRLILTLTLPADTRERVRRSLVPLGQFPRLGSKLEGRWSGLRFILGPWRWMLIVYQFDESGDRVTVVTIQDARSSRAATAAR
jgi:plasmid stabilization system protein ParE